MTMQFNLILSYNHYHQYAEFVYLIKRGRSCYKQYLQSYKIPEMGLVIDEKKFQCGNSKV